MFTSVKTKDVEEAMVKSNHDFEVEMQPLVTTTGQAVWDKQGVIRKDNGAYLGTVGMHVRHIQPKEFYAMAAELIQSTDGEITRTITLGGGAVIGISFTLARKEYLAGDASDHNLLFLTSYDSSYAILARAFNYRFACMNMLAGSTRLFSIKNTTQNFHRIKAATNMLKYYHEEMESFDQKMKLLTNHKMSDTKALEWFGTKVLNPPAHDNKRANTIYDNALDQFNNLLKNGQGTSISGVRGTAYGVLNAGTEWCNHERPTRIKEGKTEEEVRFSSNILGGSSDKTMQIMMSTLLETVNTVPSGSIV